MATFTTIDADKAPARPGYGRLKGRMGEYEGFLTKVTKGHVGKLAPSRGETARGLVLRIKRAGTRVGNDVDAWVVDGVAYFRVI